MKIKKYANAQIFRVMIQLLFFVLMPGLFISAFADIKQIFAGIVKHDFSFTSSLPQMMVTLAILTVTVLAGRFFCGYMCAFGTYGDMLFKFSKKFLKISFRISEKWDKALKYTKYIILVLILGLAGFTAINYDAIDPWNVFGILASFNKIPNISYAFSAFTIGFILFILITIASLFVERFFCRYLCPLGAIFSILARLRLTKVRKPSSGCGSCKMCTKNCPMGIPMYQYDKINSGECINCFKCLPVCPRSNTSFNASKQEIRSGIATAITVSAIAGFYYVGNAVSSAQGQTTQSHIAATQTTKSTANTSSNISTGKYKDGTYEGTGQGFRGGQTTVSVTVTNGSIQDIQVTSYQDDAPYFNRAYSQMVSRILSNQSTDVNAVSGATFSSKGIMEAVANALTNAH